MKETNKNKKALVLFSGGQDSTTCLYWAKKNYEEVHTISINYGQKHIAELKATEKINELAKVQSSRTFNLNILKEIGDSALLNEEDVRNSHRSDKDLPASFVPGRNILFLTIAGAYAYKLGINDVITGVNQTDYSGYPDCREGTMLSLEQTLLLGMQYNINIITPLIAVTKRQTVIMAVNLEGCMEALKYSHTCYNGMTPGCGECPSCILRERGFVDAGIKDPIFTIGE